MENKLKFSYLLNPILLKMFDGSTPSNVSKKVWMLITFSTGETHHLELFVTSLDENYSLILGYDWLAQHNPSIDWTETKITFRESKNPKEKLASGEKIDIHMVSALTMTKLCKDPGTPAFMISLANLIPSQATAANTLDSILDEYHDFSNVFSGEKVGTLAPHRPYDLQINIEEGVKPIHGPIYSLSPPELAALREFLEEHTKSGFICPSKSPWGSPILFVKKKDGSLCLCVDFRALNRVTEKDHYPLPLISDLLTSPAPARIYSKIDLKHAYHLVHIAKGDKPKTAFCTCYGSYEWQVMPFGLSNMPAAFQRFINEVLGDLMDICMVGYLDNILIYSDSLEDHRDHVCEVLHHLCMAGLYSNLKKCKFHKDTVEYLGFILSPKGLQMDPTKVSMIQDWPKPQKVRDIQAFLGFTNFYQRFIHDYSETTLPLNHLCKKSTTWHFGMEEAKAFQNLKKAFGSTLVLPHCAPDLPMMVEMDASDCAIVGILSVTTEDGEIWLVAFYSHTLQSAERNYDMHDKELLAIYEAFKSWHHYLEGSAKTIDMVTDHKNLEYFTTTKKLTRWQARWSKFLSQFNLSIRFRPGRLGAKPDALTQRPDVYSESVVTDCNRRPVLTLQQLERPHLAICLGTVEEVEQSLSEDLDHRALITDITRAAELDHLTQELQSKLETSDPPWGWEWSEGQPDQEILCLQVIHNHHDHPAAGHFREARTSELIHC